MSPAQVISDVFLVLGLLIVAASCIGVAVMDDAMDRLHLVTPAALLGTLAVCAAVVVRVGLSASGMAAIAVAAIIIATAPFTSHAMARSILVRRRADAAGSDSADGPADHSRGGRS
ncbi:MAG: monovalent cation/H(+) antiporter subunit G [Acidimicrobiales bacterium]